MATGATIEDRIWLPGTLNTAVITDLLRLNKPTQSHFHILQCHRVPVLSSLIRNDLDMRNEIPDVVPKDMPMAPENVEQLGSLSSLLEHCM